MDICQGEIPNALVRKNVEKLNNKKKKEKKNLNWTKISNQSNFDFVQLY